jgi:hypothetical protein
MTTAQQHRTTIELVIFAAGSSVLLKLDRTPADDRRESERQSRKKRAGGCDS